MELTKVAYIFMTLHPPSAADFLSFTCCVVFPWFLSQLPKKRKKKKKKKLGKRRRRWEKEEEGGKKKKKVGKKNIEKGRSVMVRARVRVRVRDRVRVRQ